MRDKGDYTVAMQQWRLYTVAVQKWRLYSPRMQQCHKSMATIGSAATNSLPVAPPRHVVVLLFPNQCIHLLYFCFVVCIYIGCVCVHSVRSIMLTKLYNCQFNKAVVSIVVGETAVCLSTLDCKRCCVAAIKGLVARSSRGAANPILELPWTAPLQTKRNWARVFVARLYYTR